MSIGHMTGGDSLVVVVYGNGILQVRDEGFSTGAIETNSPYVHAVTKQDLSRRAWGRGGGRGRGRTISRVEIRQ